MKKFIYTLLLLVSLMIVFSLSASAELYSPSYYGAQQVAAGTIAIDGKVDPAYGNPIFYYIQDGTDDIGDPSKQENWFYTNGSLEDAQFIVTNPNQYAKGYVAWNDDKLYVCVDTNIDGWNFDNIVDGAIVGAGKMWQAYCLQIGIFDYEKGSNIDWGLGSDSNGNSHQYNFVSSNGALIPTGETQWEAAATRDLNHVIYEAAIPLDKVLGRTPVAGSKIDMDICIFEIKSHVPEIDTGFFGSILCHTGTVYMDGKALTEALSIEALAEKPMQWYAEVREHRP